jgi:pimeloyl-ACP methyl ester carboxylesterase
MAQVYRTCGTYRDTGVVRTVYVEKLGERTDEKPFRTAFVRPDRFRFEFTYKHFLGNPDRYIVWRQGSDVRSWWGVRPGVEKLESLSEGLSGATGVSGGSAHTVPRLLLPGEVDGRSLEEMTGVVRLADSPCGQSTCSVVEGLYADQKRKIWIDPRTYLLRRVEGATAFEGFRTVETTTYEPRVNEPPRDGDLEFGAPTGSPPASQAVAVPASSPAAADPRFDAELTAYSYPFPVRFHEFKAQNQALKMAYMDVAAEKPNGHTVLLLHGKNFSASYWEPTIRFLTARGYRVIAPDQIGFGKSSKPAAYQFSFQALAQSTNALLDAAGVKEVSVVGHSMGGMLATRFALLYPGRVERLALVNPIGLEDWKTVVPYRSIDAWYAQELKATADTVREYQKQSYYDGQWKPEYERLIEIAAGVTKHPDYSRTAWCSALTYDMIFTQPVVYEFPLVKVPTLLVIGQRDRTALGRAWAPKEAAATLGDYPALGRRTAAAIPGAKLVEIPGVGHLPQMEAFEAYSKALADFLP